MGKTDEEKKRLKVEREHKNAAEKLQSKRLSEQAKHDKECLDDASGESSEEIDDLQEVLKDYEENGWFDPRKSVT